MGFRMGKKIKESSTTAGGVAPVAQSMHTDRRSVVGQGIYGKTKGGSMFTGKKTSKKFANSIAEAQKVEEGIFDIFTNKDTKKSKKVAVSTDDEEGKISFSDLGKNAMFDPNDKRITDDQRIFYEFILSQKNKADLTDFINVINHYIRKYKEALRKEGGSNPLNSGRLKVLNYFERQLEKMPIKESDISEELLAKRLAQDFKSFKRPKDREISKRSRDRDILPKQEFNEVSASAIAPAAKVATNVGGNMAGKLIPGVGLALGGYDAYQRAKKGDYIGAGLSALGGVTSLVPGIGTAASLGLAGTQLARDYTKKTGAFAPDEEEIAKAGSAGAPNKPAKTAALSPSQVSAATPAAKPRVASQDPTVDPYNPASDTTLQAGNREVAAAPAPSNFKQAFAAARRGGEGSFTYNGKEYNTQLAEQALTKMKKIKPTIKQDKLSPQEKFKGSVKRAGYDMDAGANRLLKLLDKQAKERAERDSEGVNEWVSRREEFNPQPAISTMESADSVKTFRVSLVDRMTDEPKTVTVKASSNEEAEAKAEKQHSGYDVRGSRKISEGAKVDRMVKHIEKSERATGKDKKEAENIAWATANKRGYLDNKNKKKHVTEGRVKDLAMAIDELTHDGKTPGQIAKELDIPLMIVLKFKADMDKMDKPVVAKGQLNEFDPDGYEQYTLYTGDHHKQYQVNDEKFKSIEDAIEEAKFLMDADPKSKMSLWTVQDMDNNIVWSHDPAEIYDRMRSASKVQFLKPGKKDIDEASFDSAEYDDESGMAHNQLKTIARSVKGLMDTIDDGDNLPEWVQKKLALAEDHLVTIWDYLQSEKSDDEVMEARDGDTNFGSTVTHGSWVVYNGSKVKRFKSRDGAKAYAEKNGGKVASSEFYADKIQKQSVSEAQQCPECGGAAYDNEILAEKQDACYSKVKSRYKVWPSAYASGALVRCRKVGAKNWGNKSKKK